MPYFAGELMTCCVCGATERSDPAIETQWRVIVVDNTPYYACPREFPADGATVDAFQAAYTHVLETIATLRKTRPGVSYAN